jgi:hypothetical protein
MDSQGQKARIDIFSGWGKFRLNPLREETKHHIKQDSDIAYFHA